MAINPKGKLREYTNRSLDGFKNPIKVAITEASVSSLKRAIHEKKLKEFAIVKDIVICSLSATLIEDNSLFFKFSFHNKEHELITIKIEAILKSEIYKVILYNKFYHKNFGAKGSKAILIKGGKTFFIELEKISHNNKKYRKRIKSVNSTIKKVI